MKWHLGLLFFVANLALAEAPACIGSDVSLWDKCRGSHTYPSGDKYVGNFVSGKFSGFGQLLSKNGDSYTGDWFENMPHGLGKATFADGRVPAEGKWINGLFSQPQVVNLGSIDKSPKLTTDVIPVDCKVENNPIIKISYKSCIQIGGAVLNTTNLKCIIGSNLPIFLSPDLCTKVNGLIVN